MQNKSITTFILICTIIFTLLTACGGDKDDGPSANITPLAAESATEPPAEATTAPAGTPAPPTDTPTPAAPQMGDIVFALTVDDNAQAIDPADAFDEGISKIHAVFDYANLSRDDTWERVWYLDGEEMLRNAENWGGDESGSFDYFLDTGGAPLPPGSWILELSLNGEFMSSGMFVVKAKATPTPSPAPSATITPTPTITPTAKPVAAVYQLAYTKWNGNYHSVYTANTNGYGEKFIIDRGAGPSWSVDGRRLFFYGEAGVNQQIREGQVGCEFGTISDGIVAIDLWTSNGDICQVKPGPWFCERKGSDAQSPPHDVCTENGVNVFQNLDWKEGTARWASVAPDGAAVAYDGTPGGGDRRIYFRSVYNNQQFRFELIGEQGSWSPDGQKMVYRSGRDNKQGLWISNRDDTGHANITLNGTDSFPAWSPNGRMIAFSREEAGNVDIYTLNLNSGDIRRLTTAPGPDTLPVYAPDGSIIFRSARSGSWGIWKMYGNGSGQREIIPKAGVGPDWAYSKMDVR